MSTQPRHPTERTTKASAAIESSKTVQRRRYAKRMAPSDRREQLLDAALELVAREGLEALSMQAVATQAGVTKPVVYDYFANIDELGSALFERAEQTAVRSVAAAWPFIQIPDDLASEKLFGEVAGEFLRAALVLDPEELILQALTNWLQAVAAQPDTWRVILKPPEGAPASMRERLERTHQNGVAAFATVIPWLVHSRGWSSDIDPQLLAHVLHASLLRAAQLVVDEPERFSPEAIAAFAGRILAAAEHEPLR